VSRTIRSVGIVTMVTAALIGLSGCSSNDKVPSADNPVTNVEVTPVPQATQGGKTTGNEPVIPSNAPEAPVANSDGAIDYCAGQAPFTGDVADQFGADNVMAAYCEMVGFTLDQSTWVNNLLAPLPDGQKRQLVEYSFVKDYMTDRQQQEWDATVQKAIDGDKASSDRVFLLIFNDITGEGLTFPDRPDLVTNKKWSPAVLGSDTAGPDGADRLTMEFTVSADVNVLVNNEPKVINMSKDITYALVPTGLTDRPWAIDGFTATWKTNVA
jgi:hypothetical protein